MASSRQNMDEQDSGMLLAPPVPPLSDFAKPDSASSSLRTAPLPLSGTNSPTTSSLSVNFLPSKFSGPLPSKSLRKRKGKGTLPKRGGGREVFRNSEARMPGEKDEDYDGVDINNGKWKAAAPLRWNGFKWILFCTNLMVSAYSLVSFVVCLLTWFNVWTNADVIRVGDRTLLILSTLASSAAIVTSLIGWAGILLNNRGFLAVFTFLLWVTFALICTPGYIAYKTRTFNLEGKVNAQWSRSLDQTGRLRIQNQLGCCGYYSPFVEATVSQLCYARSVLPGCKNKYLKFQRVTLERWYGIAFGLVPFHLLAILAALLCSNHVTYRFGKGMMPKAYRLNVNSMAVIVDNYATQISDKYGKGVASGLLAHSRSNLHLNSVPSLRHSSGSQASSSSSGYPPRLTAINEK